ncbi:MAG: sensor histidine kinase [Ferruginibacter sp.]|nr:sensor histidine kinase [Ferruginibacter sp.]
MGASRTVELFYLFFEGIMLFQVVFFGMVYLISKRRDVLYYSLLNFIAGSYFFLNAPDTFLGIDENIVFNSPVYLYANFAIFMSMIFMYPLFLKEIFNDTVEQYGYVKKIYTATVYAIPILYLLFVLFACLGWKTNIIFYTGHLINGPFCTVIVVLNIRQQGYKKLIIYGMLAIFICVNATLALTIRNNAGSNITILDKYPLVFIKVGMLIDILLFQLALLKRWNEQEKQLAVEKLQSQLEMEKIRNKISSELHDDIGSTLSGVSMYSYMANTQLQNGEHENLKTTLQTIQQSAGEVVNKLGDLVWSVKAGQHSLQLLFERLEQYGFEMCKAKNIQFKTNILISNFSLPSEKHYQLYLFCKEAINNAAKYSEASMLELIVKESNQLLEITLSDNGKGFDAESVKRGNGLDNMQKRATEMGADFNLQSKPDKGCLISLNVKIT